MPFIEGQAPSSGGQVPLTTHQQVVAGDDYKAADGRAITWSSGAWPNLASATLTMVVGHDEYNLYGNLPLTWTGSVPASPANPTEISLDVPGTQTVNLPPDQYDYTLSATLVDGDKIPIAIGMLTVQADPGIASLYPPAI